MALEVLGLDHIYIAVSDLARSTTFYDDVMQLLGFRKGTDPVGGQPHFHYFNRAFQGTRTSRLRSSFSTLIQPNAARQIIASRWVLETSTADLVQPDLGIPLQQEPMRTALIAST
jgi:catechol 2,3-dioxygenase-like lactoylglutathione lyase family enzyme